MSVSWSTGLPSAELLTFRRVLRWLRRLFYRGDHGRPLQLAELQLPCREPGSYATAPELPWWADLDAEPVRIWPELDLLPVDRYLDRLFAPLERRWAA